MIEGTRGAGASTGVESGATTGGFSGVVICSGTGIGSTWTESVPFTTTYSTSRCVTGFGTWTFAM